MVVVVVVVASIYIRGAHAHTRARIHHYQHGCQVVSHKKGKKKTLEHSPTHPTDHKETGNQMISETP